MIATHYHPETKRSSVFDCTYRKRVSVLNRKNRDIRIRLAYAVPVSEVEEARVTLHRSEFSVKPSEEDEERGHLFWDLNVKAGEEASHYFEYRLVGPRELVHTQAKPTGDFGVLMLD
jgi:hypothetical protein